MSTAATVIESYAAKANPSDHAHILLMTHLAVALDAMVDKGSVDLSVGEMVEIAGALSRSLSPHHIETAKYADGTVVHSLAVKFEVAS